MRRLLWTSVLFALLLPALAEAATVSNTSYGYLTYSDTAGQENSLTVSDDGRIERCVVDASRAGIDAGGVDEGQVGAGALDLEIVDLTGLGEEEDRRGAGDLDLRRLGLSGQQDGKQDTRPDESTHASIVAPFFGATSRSGISPSVRALNCLTQTGFVVSTQPNVQCCR